MATSIYFNNQRAKQEQFLLEDLIIESIKNHGVDVYYLPRSSNSSIDELFGDDPVKLYNSAIKIEVYPEDFKDYQGNKEFFSKFGLQIQETAKLCLSRRTFERTVTSLLPQTHHVPKEGDLIYLPIQYKLMELKFVEEEKNFFQLGRDSKNPYMYGLSVEAFKYNGELLRTGISEIDRIGNDVAFGLEQFVQVGGTGIFEEFEWIYQGDSLNEAHAKAVMIDWDVTKLSIYVRNIKGDFTPNEVIKGSKSGAQWILRDVNNMTSINIKNVDDNTRIETESLNFLDFSENNPFGNVDD